MADPLHVLGVHMVDASPAHLRKGILGYLTIELPGEMVLKDVTLRRSRQGRLYVSFPKNRHGYPNILLRTKNALRDLEHQISEKLGIQPAHFLTNRTSRGGGDVP